MRNRSMLVSLKRKVGTKLCELFASVKETSTGPRDAFMDALFTRGTSHAEMLQLSILYVYSFDRNPSYMSRHICVALEYRKYSNNSLHSWLFLFRIIRVMREKNCRFN